MRRLLGSHKSSGGAGWKLATSVTLQRRFVSAPWRGQRKAKIAVPRLAPLFAATTLGQTANILPSV